MMGVNVTDDTELLSIDEVCEMLKIGRGRCYMMLNGGLIKAFRIGRAWKVPRSSIRDFIRKQTEET